MKYIKSFAEINESQQSVFDIKENEIEVYHGTTLTFWNKDWTEEDGNSTLYLTSNYNGAVMFAEASADSDITQAYEEAMEEGIDIQNEDGSYIDIGYKPTMIVVSIRLHELMKHNFEFQPDWNAEDVVDDTTWVETFRKYGSFCVYGDVKSLKHLFKIDII
jgi:hypothetical protein